MDDATQDPNIPVQNTQVVDDTTQGVNPVVQQPPQQPQQPIEPVGGMHKEAGPTMVVEQPVAEVLTPSESEPVLHPEVVEAGVEVSKNLEAPPDLTMHDKGMIEHAPVIAPVPTQPSGTLQYLIPEEKAVETLKHKNTSKSITWLAESVIRQIKIMHGKISGGH
jgi:hypothetical protein